MSLQLATIRANEPTTYVSGSNRDHLFAPSPAPAASPSHRIAPPRGIRPWENALARAEHVQRVEPGLAGREPAPAGAEVVAPARRRRLDSTHARPHRAGSVERSTPKMYITPSGVAGTTADVFLSHLKRRPQKPGQYYSTP
uniref:Uncharacterized protein n=1 Tax=Oryza brachyantha TaxID=4533 RepID=J3LZP3_ORYBR